MKAELNSLLALLLGAQALGAQPFGSDQYGIADLHLGASFSTVVNQLHPDSYVCTYTLSEPLPSCGLFRISSRYLGEFGRVDGARFLVDRDGIVLLAHFTQTLAGHEALAAKSEALAGMWGTPDTKSETCSKWGEYPDARASLCLIEEERPKLILWMMAGDQRVNEARRTASNALEASVSTRRPGIRYNFFPDWRPYWVGGLRAGMHRSVFSAELQPRSPEICTPLERGTFSNDSADRWCTWRGPLGIAINGESVRKVTASVHSETDRVKSFQLLIGHYAKEAQALSVATKIADQLSSDWGWGEPRRRSEGYFDWSRSPFHAGVGIGWDDREPERPWYITIRTSVVGGGQERDPAEVRNAIGG